MEYIAQVQDNDEDQAFRQDVADITFNHYCREPGAVTIDIDRVKSHIDELARACRDIAAVADRRVAHLDRRETLVGTFGDLRTAIQTVYDTWAPLPFKRPESIPSRNTHREALTQPAASAGVIARQAAKGWADRGWENGGGRGPRRKRRRKRYWA